MKQLIKILLPTFVLLIPTAAYSQENLDLNQLDGKLLQQLACTGNTSNPELQASLEQLASMLTETSTDISFTEAELQTAYSQLTQIQSELLSNETVQEFCSDY